MTVVCVLCTVCYVLKEVHNLFGKLFHISLMTTKK